MTTYTEHYWKNDALYHKCLRGFTFLLYLVALRK
jgi:hypothetical protein